MKKEINKKIRKIISNLIKKIKLKESKTPQYKISELFSIKKKMNKKVKTQIETTRGENDKGRFIENDTMYVSDTPNLGYNYCNIFDGKEIIWIHDKLPITNNITIK